MATSSENESNPTVEVGIISHLIVSSDVYVKALSTLIDDATIDANDKVRYIAKRIYINYHKHNWTNAIEDINTYQQITKSKKFELLKLKSELQRCCHKSRMTLMELTNNNDIDDNDEHERFFFIISPKNVDDFINGRLTSKSNKKQKI